MHVYIYEERERCLAFLSCMKALLSEDLGLAMAPRFRSSTAR